MSIIIVSNYYYPEIGAAPNRIWNMAEGLASNWKEINVICPFPNYPKGKIFDGYKGKIHSKEQINNIGVHRYWIYPSVSKNPFLRILSMLSFAFTLWAFVLNKKKIKEADWIIIQNSPLLVSFSSIILFKKVFNKKIALNISDLWPLSALELGAIKKGKLYSFLEWIEKYNYKNSDLIIGQSEEILDHAINIVPKQKILYRNIQRKVIKLVQKHPDRHSTKIVYAGLLGVAQGVFNIISKINFSEIGVELDIYGQGNEQEKITSFLRNNPNCGITYKGSVSKMELDNILPNYDASIVPLVNRIKGAVPSKIFELIQIGIPILFCGGGEGALIVEKHEVGFTSPPGDIEALKNTITKLKSLSEGDYKTIVDNCNKAAIDSFNFDRQMSELVAVLSYEKM
jgi:glycosyltransferase involved in cell wall biosynthesis